MMSRKKISLIVAIAAIFAFFAIFATLSATKGVERNVVFAEEEEITLLETKAKVSLDDKYLLLITGFDAANLKSNGLYYIGYKYTVDGVEVDTAREVGADAAKYYATITLRTDLEDESKTQVVTPEMIYGETYADYKLIVHEIEFTTTFSEEKSHLSDIYAYIDEVEQVGEEYEVVNSSSGEKYQDKDEYRIENGNFENGLTGWTRSNNDIGDVIDSDCYWAERVSFNKSGEHLFSAYTVINSEYAESGNEGAKGTLTSSVFKLGGTGYITYKLGGGRHYDKVFLEVVEDETDIVLARYYNSEWIEAEHRGCVLNQYRADLREFLGKDVYIRITDNAENDYGLFFVDDIVTYYSWTPDIGTEAKNILVNAVNGSFDKDLYGWSLSDDMGEITSLDNFWDNVPINNTGKYFRGDLNDKEGETGTLTSADFKLAGSGFITFKLGAAGNENCYVTVDKKVNNGYETVALWHNTEWADGAENAERAGYGLRLVEYKADLSDYIGETLRLVLHDEATGGFGFFTFDELKTYYAVEPNGTLISNQVPVRANLLAVLEAEDIDEQGEYTSASYAEYVAKKSAAENLSAHSKIATINNAISELATAKANLTERVPVERNTDKNIVLAPNAEQEITVSDHVDEDGLSGVTYSVDVDDDTVATVSAISNGKFTVTAASDGTATVTLSVSRHSAVVLTVDFAVEVSTVPTLKAASVTENLDIYSLVNKDDYTLDFTENVENPAEMSLTYSATVSVNGGAASAIVLTNNGYTYDFGSYNDVVTVVTFAVTVSYERNGVQNLNYNYVLNIKDSTAYRLANGGFETGDLSGWTLDNAALGNVIGSERYWNEGILFNKDGNYLFSAYTNINGKGYAESGDEAAKGTLRSSSFVIGGAGFITYKLGGAKNADGVWIDVVDASNGDILGRFYNNLHSEANLSGCALVAYKADLSGDNNANLGKTAYLRVVDNAVTGYGLFFLDSVETYHEEEPSNAFNTALLVANRPANIYQVYNGDFETGNFDGWAKTGDFVRISEQAYYWSNENCAYGKDGSYLISGVEDAGQPNLEGNTGTLISAPFVVGGSGYITFKLGGGGNALCYIDIIDMISGNTLARFHNDNLDEARMKLYKADLSAYLGKTVCIKIIDEATNSWGCLSADSFVTYCQTEPTVYDFVAADHKYEVINGSFEIGTLGWTLVTTVADDNNSFGFINETNDVVTWGDGASYNNDGAFLQNGHERSKGYALSSAFVVSDNGWMTFKLGGNKEYSGLAIVDAVTGVEIARFVNEDFEGAWPNKGWEMHAYKVNLIDSGIAAGTLVRVKLIDDAFENYGVITADSIVTYYANEPVEGFKRIYKI